MIVEMTRIRVLGPRDRLAAAVAALQDSGTVQLVDAAPLDGAQAEPPRTTRRRRDLARAIADVEHALDVLRELGAPVGDREGKPPREGRAAWLGARLGRRLDELRARARGAGDERDELRGYAPLLAVLDELLRPGADRQSLFLLRVATGQLEPLRDALARVVGEAMVFRPHALATGEHVLLLVVPRARAHAIENALATAGVEHAPLPRAIGNMPLADALLRLRPRLAELDRELAAIRDEVAEVARTHGDELARARRGLHDALLALGAAERAALSARVFAIEGWIPARERDALRRALFAALGPELAIEELARDEWRAEDAPVVLANPPLFAPFELLTSMLPLPRYGTIDPTPFVAVFFPMLFGVIVGDVGYGVAIAALAGVFYLAGRRTRALAQIAAAVALYTIVFGVLYGELFGELGTRWFGMRPLWFDRREAVLGFLVLAIALGLVHLVLGLVIAAVTRWRGDHREAIGRGLTAVMLLVVACALLALFHRAPGVLLAPAVVVLLVALPVIIVLEGATALLDLMSIVGHVLSYARVMALGTASVMLAVVANKMYGAFGSAALGIAFALVFHFVNFAITLFSPTIQVLRLHYVEFFGTFFEPGGGPYQPLRHWSPEATS